MSKWVPRAEYAKNLTNDQLLDFYIKSDPRKASPAPRRTTKAKAYPSAVRGRGAYSTDGKKKARRTGAVPNKLANKNFQSDYGSRLGSVIGEGMQSFANALGFGEYSIQQNSCLSMIDMGTSPPRVKNTNRGEAMIVNHREYLGDLSTGAGTPTAFTLQTYAINPGNSTLFPFTKRIAENFQEWEIRGMLVELKSLASNTATALSLGSMFAAVDYNTLDPAPTNKIELENLEYACSNKPTDSIIMPVECARKNDVLTHLYIAVDNDYLGGDKRFYDIGNLFVGSFGCPTPNVPIAEIWVTYEIALYKPHLHIEPPLQFAAHYFSPDVVDAQPFLAVSEVFNNAEITMGPDVIFFPEKPDPVKYLITLYWESTNATVTGFTTPILTGCTFNGIFGGIPSTYITNGGANTNKMFITTSVIVPAATSGASIEFAGLTLPGTAVTDEPFVTVIINHLSESFVLPEDLLLEEFKNQEKRKKDSYEERMYEEFKNRFLSEINIVQDTQPVVTPPPQVTTPITRLSGKFL